MPTTPFGDDAVVTPKGGVRVFAAVGSLAASLLAALPRSRGHGRANKAFDPAKDPGLSPENPAIAGTRFGVCHRLEEG